MKDPIFLVFLAAAIFLLVQLFREPPKLEEDNEEPARPPEDRDLLVSRELRRMLDPDPKQREEASRRMLALGPGVLPLICKHLRASCQGSAPPQRAHRAELEDLIASFGLRSVGPLAQILAKATFPSPLLPSVLRTVMRLGPSAIPALVASLEENNIDTLTLLLHCFPGIPEPHVLRALPALPPQGRSRILQAFGGVLERHPGPMIGLFDGGSDPLRHHLVDFYRHWPTPLAAEILVRALEDPSAEMRASSALALGLLIAEPPPQLCLALEDTDQGVRHAALTALQALDCRLVTGILAEHIRRGSTADRIQAILSLPYTELKAPEVEELLVNARTEQDLLTRLAAESTLCAFGLLPADGPLQLYRELDQQAPLGLLVGTRSLGLMANHDVRALEQLIRLSDADDPVVRAAACAAVADAAPKELPDLLNRAVLRHQQGAVEHFYLRLAALRCGETVVPLLARLVRSGSQQQALLAAELIASTGSSLALLELLRSRPHRHGSPIASAIASHAAAFGPKATELARELLASQQGAASRSACSFLLQFAAGEHCARILGSVLDHQPTRTIALAGLELLAVVHPDAVLSALDERNNPAAFPELRDRLGLH